MLSKGGVLSSMIYGMYQYVGLHNDPHRVLFFVRRATVAGEHEREIP